MVYVHGMQSTDVRQPVFYAFLAFEFAFTLQHVNLTETQLRDCRIVSQSLLDNF